MPAPLRFVVQAGQHRPKAVQARFEVFDDLLGQLVRFRQVVEVGEAFVFEPEDIETGLVARGEFFVCVLAPAAVGVLFGVPLRLAFVAVRGAVAFDEPGEVFEAQRLLFQGVMDIRPVVVVPDFLGPGVLASFAALAGATYPRGCGPPIASGSCRPSAAASRACG